jgi:predicted dinucleotide-binding enzyme
MTGARIASPTQAAAECDLVFLALPWSVMDVTIPALGDLAGKIVIDCTNPLGMVDGKLALLFGHDRSGGERGGSVCLNSFWSADKWFLPSVMPQPGLAAAH